MPYKGETIRIKAILTDYDGDKFTPDSQEIHIYDPSGNDVSGSPFTPTQLDTGVYYVDYSIPSDADEGTYKVVWIATKGGKTIGVTSFKVVSVG